MPPESLTRDHIVWAYRLLLDREPENEAVIEPKLKAYAGTRELRADIMSSEEFRANNQDFAQANTRTVVIAELGDGLRLLVDLADHAIGLNIVRGRFEQSELQFIRRVVGPGQTVIDAGAHVGFFTIHLAALVGDTGRVWAFEPSTDNADLLARSIVENRFERRVTLHRAALAETGRRAQLVYARETLNTGGAFLLPPGALVPAGHEARAIELMALDELDLPRPVSFLKMDVEGAEPRLVAGARGLLAADRPMILSELHADQLRRVSDCTPADFVRTMEQLGYVCRRLQRGRPGERMAGGSAETVCSIVLLPRELDGSSRIGFS
jgi:FkbM family methyltransferase